MRTQLLGKEMTAGLALGQMVTVRTTKGSYLAVYLGRAPRSGRLVVKRMGRPFPTTLPQAALVEAGGVVYGGRKWPSTIACQVD